MPLRGRTPSYEKNRVAGLKWSALKYELDPENDYARAGNTPPERAFQVLNSGFYLAFGIAREGIPSVDPRTRKRAGKWLMENIPFRDAPVGVNVLGIALPTVMARSGGNLDGAVEGQGATVEQHERLAASVNDFYPLESRRRTIMTDALEEYEVMETKQARPPVANGVQPGSAYSQALVRGEDPDLDPALVAEQRRWARDYFISHITISACALILGPDLARVEDKMSRLIDLEEGVGEYRERLLGAWVRGSQVYRDYALLDENPDFA
jgi:hypothetical protein